MINPKQLYILYLSLKLHFTQKSYNIVEYRGHIKAKPLDERNDRFLFYKWAKKFNTEKEAIEFLTANFSRGNFYPFSPENEDVAVKIHKEWIKIKESAKKYFKDDLNFLERNEVCYNTNTDALYEVYLKGKIQLETIAVLDFYENFLQKAIDAKSIWSQEYQRIKKYQLLIPNRIKKLHKIYLDHQQQNETI